MGLLTEVVARGRATSSARSRSPRASPRFPQATMLADRRAAIEGFGLPLDEALALEAQAGPEVFDDGARRRRALRRAARAAAARARAP